MSPVLVFLHPDGFMGGGQIGYNWQFSPIWVVGLEADFQGALERDSANLNNPFSATTTFFSAGGVPISPATVTGTAVTDYTTKIEWFGTARVRIGYVWGNGDVMSYLTGGLAYGKVDLEGTNTVNGAFLVPIFIPFTVSSNFSHSAINAGWVVGYGTEGRLGNSNWTWKVEGLYMDLGTLDTSVSTAASTGSSALGPGTATGGPTTHTHFTDSILRGGLNYQFH